MQLKVISKDVFTLRLQRTSGCSVCPMWSDVVPRSPMWSDVARCGPMLSDVVRCGN